MMTEEQRGKALDEFYIPLMFMAVRGRNVFRSFLLTLGRQYVFVWNGPLPKSEMNLWGVWAEKAFIPMNTEMAVLLEDGDRHIPVGSNLRASKWQFISYHENFRAAHDYWRKNGGTYRHPGNFPQQFQVDAMMDFLRLTGADPNPTYAGARRALDYGF
jgi:hypothetical protein